MSDQQDWEVPWPEPFGTGSPERSRLATEFGEAIRKTGALMQLVGRDTKDRRRVVVHLVLDRALRDVAPLFVPLLHDWQEIASRYTDDELRLIVEFYGHMEQVFRAHVVRLRESGAPG